MNEMEKAIEDLRQHAGRSLKIPLGVETVELAVEAMGRQMPQKVIDTRMPIEKGGQLTGWKCPTCSIRLAHGKGKEFCSDCGQALDWSGENG